VDQLEDHLDKLPIFLEMVRARSIRGAARALKRSQPAVSRSMRLLEDAVGGRLFVRGPGGIKLTTKGQRLFELADQVRTGVARFRAGSADDRRIRQQVTLGAFESIAIYFLPGFLRYAVDLDSRLEISLRTAPSRALFDALRRSQLDIILSVDPPAHRSVYSATLFEDEFRIYRHPALDHGDAPLLVFDAAADANGRTIASHVQRSRYARRRRFSCASFEVAASLAAAAIGIAILPTRVAARSLTTRQLVEVEDGGRSWRFGTHAIALSYLRHRLGDPGIVWIQRALEQYESVRTRG
jgi:DNA-binding transcriptional LysR family regulator